MRGAVAVRRLQLVTNISSPNQKLWQRLNDALDKLEELGTVRYWEADPSWSEVMEELTPKKGKKPRLTRGLWARILSCTVTIESGPKYNQHYAGHRLTGKTIDPLALELREYLQSTNRPQATIAEELRVSQSTLSRWLSGKARPPAEKRGDIEAMILRSRNLSLFDNNS